MFSLLPFPFSPSTHPFLWLSCFLCQSIFYSCRSRAMKPPPPRPPSLPPALWMINKGENGCWGGKVKSGRGAGGCEAVSGRESMKSREMARVKEGEAWSGWIWRWINGPRVEEEKNAPQIMKLCSENVSQFPCFQRTNYRTKRENVSFMTSKLGRCRLIFPLFVSCCVCFFFFLPKLLLASSSQRTAIPQDKDHNHTHTHQSQGL